MLNVMIKWLFCMLPTLFMRSFSSMTANSVDNLSVNCWKLPSNSVKFMNIYSYHNILIDLIQSIKIEFNVPSTEYSRPNKYKPHTKN